MQPLEPDDPERVGGHRLRARLGAGGMGVVYLAHSPGGRTVAVKVVQPRFARSARHRARFRREVAAARTVTGAFTAPVLDADPDADVPWLVTAYLPGLSLRAAVAVHGPLPPGTVRLLAAALAEALVAVHGAGLTHRDLKPENVLLTPEGPQVIDFGIARAEEATALTAPGALLGTPGFMSPEQASGGLAGPAGDLFALGALLAYAATGREPFGGGERGTVLDRVRRAEADLDGLDDPVRGDRVLYDIVTRCLHREPAARPTAEALLDVLGTAAEAGVTEEGSDVSVHGTRWLPAAVAEAVDRQAAVESALAEAIGGAVDAVSGAGAAAGEPGAATGPDRVAPGSGGAGGAAAAVAAAAAAAESTASADGSAAAAPPERDQAAPPAPAVPAVRLDPSARTVPAAPSSMPGPPSPAGTPGTPGTPGAPSLAHRTTADGSPEPEGKPAQAQAPTPPPGPPRTSPAPAPAPAPHPRLRPALARPSRRTLLLSLAAVPVAAGVAAGVAHWAGTGDGDEPSGAGRAPADGAPGSPSRTASPAPTAPPVATTVWRTLAADHPTGEDPGHYPDLYTTGTVVLAARSDGRMRALDARTGHILWSYRADMGSGDTAVTGHGTVYVVDPRKNDSYVFRALDPADGSTRWTYAMPWGMFPWGIASTGSVGCLSYGDDILGFTAGNGKRRWSARVTGIQVAARDGYLAAAGNAALTCVDTDDGRVRWKHKVSDSSINPLVGEGLVLTRDQDGVLYAFHAADGRRAWRKSLDYRAPVHVLGDGRLYVDAPDGTVRALSAESGAEVWAQQPGRAPEGSYGLGTTTLGTAGGTVWAAGPDATVYALDPSDGQVRWTFGASTVLGHDGAVAAAGAVTVAGLVIVSTSDGHLLAVRPPGPGARGSGGASGDGDGGRGGSGAGSGGGGAYGAA